MYHTKDKFTSLHSGFIVIIVREKTKWNFSMKLIFLKASTLTQVSFILDVSSELFRCLRVTISL